MPRRKRRAERLIDSVGNIYSNLMLPGLEKLAPPSWSPVTFFCYDCKMGFQAPFFTLECYWCKSESITTESH